MLFLIYVADYCLNKANNADDPHKKYIWHFLKASFEYDSRAELLSLLGYRVEDVQRKLVQHVDGHLKNNIENLSDQFSNVNNVSTSYFTLLITSFP